jgi:hypothetical protein
MTAQPNPTPTDIEARLKQIDEALREIADQQEAQNAIANAVEMTTMDVSTDDYAVQRTALLAERRELLEARRSAS